MKIKIEKLPPGRGPIVLVPGAKRVKLGGEWFDVEERPDVVAEGLPDPETPLLVPDESKKE